MISGVRRFISLARKHYLISSIYVLGLALAALGSGLSVDPQTADFYDHKMKLASSVTANELAVATENVRRQEDIYYRSKGWFTCDAQCTRNYERLLASKERLGVIRARRDLIESEAKEKVGAWSHFAISDLRQTFWTAWEQGKEAARRMTMFDAIFIGLNSLGGSSYDDRDSSFFVTMLQIATQFLLNLTVGLVASFFSFMIESWYIITSYGPSFLSGLSLFLIATITALSVIITAIGGVVGGIVGSVFIAVRSAERKARLEGRSGPSRLHID